MKRLFIFICGLFVFGACNAATLNIKHNNITKQITLDTIQRTKPALAMRISNKTYYADLIETTTRNSNNIYVAYNNKTYMVRDNKEYAFFITTTPTTTNFDFKMSAKGNFIVDWGDGTAQEIVRTNTTETTYSHNYTQSGEYQIRFGGTATGYSTSTSVPAISFYKGNHQINPTLARIDGSLGAIFPTIEGLINTNTEIRDVFQPRFYETFRSCTGLTEIPLNLFDGVYGAPASWMFVGTFYGCAGLTKIPENLFSGIKGAPAEYVFWYTFEGCTGLTTIPEKLFEGIQGAPAPSMFRTTFAGCTGLRNVPAKLFSGIEGVPAERMYYCLFQGSGLESIPDGLFGNLYGAPAYQMFGGTFSFCENLTGPTARTADGTRLYDVKYNNQTWYQQSPDSFFRMYADSPRMDTNN